MFFGPRGSGKTATLIEMAEVPGTELLKALLQTAASNDTGVLMCVDEMHAADVGECAVLGNAVQDLMRKERLPLQFCGAAFPDFRRTALDDPQLSFFRRGEQVSMPPLTSCDAHQGFQLCAAESSGEFTSEALEAALPIYARNVSKLPLSATWATTGRSGERDICGAWMPRAAGRCALREGHAGPHRRKPWSARR